MSAREEPSWRALAECLGAPPEWWFPEETSNYTEAREVCGECVVRDECLAYALDHGYREGMWGGTSPEDRRKIRRQRRLEQRGMGTRGMGRGQEGSRGGVGGEAGGRGSRDGTDGGKV